MPPAVSVIVPLKARGPRLDECLAHLALQTFRDFDVYLVPDEYFEPPSPDVHVLASGPVLPNRKRQLAAEASGAEIVAFIDDDAYPAPEWLAAAVRHFSDANVVAAGGPGVTPASDSPRQRASGAIFASPIVTAGTRFRYVPQPQRDVEALPSCNLLIRRAAFVRDADASVAYWPGEDLLVCLFATRNGQRIVYDPEALVYHHRRTIFSAHLRQVWSYALFRGFFLRRYRRSWRNVAYAAPAAFALAHAVAAVALTRSRLRLPVLLAAGTYAGIVTWSARREARIARADALLVGIGIYLTHLTYGAGSIIGWFRGRRTRER